MSMPEDVNPYASPRAATGPESQATSLPNIEMSVGGLLNYTFELYQRRWPNFLAAGALWFAAISIIGGAWTGAAMWLPFALPGLRGMIILNLCGQAVGLLTAVVNGWFAGGFARMSYSAMAGEEPKLGDLAQANSTAIIAALATQALSTVGALVGLAIAWQQIGPEGQPPDAVLKIFFYPLAGQVVAGLFVFLATLYLYPAIAASVDRDAGFWESVGLATDVVHRHVGVVLAVNLVAMVLGVALAMLTCGLGIVLLGPFYSTLTTALYVAGVKSQDS